MVKGSEGSEQPGIPSSFDLMEGILNTIATWKEWPTVVWIVAGKIMARNISWLQEM